LDAKSIATLQKHIRAQVITPSHEQYERARRVWNAMIDRRPLLIVQPEGAHEVMATIAFAREHDLPLSVKGGGHGVAGRAICDDGVVIDLSRMAGVAVDPIARIATVQGGAILRTLDAGSQAHGLATTAGIYRQTGVTGLALGGGVGLLMRRYGLTCDNMIAAEVVTADGQILETNEIEHPDLFWALRGGGGNFGVVTRLTVRLYPLTHVLGGRLNYAFEDALDIGRFYRDVMAEAPDELQAYLALGTADTERLVSVIFCHTGSPDSAEQALQRFRSFRRPIRDTVAWVPYLQMQQHWDKSFPDSTLTYWKSSFLAPITDEAIRISVDAIANHALPNYSIDFEYMGGAVARVVDSATAFADRDAACTYLVTSGWNDPAETETRIRWVRGTWEAVQGYAKASSYVNYMDQGDENRTEVAYGANFLRLVEIKRRYDPTNIFRSTANILP
jgi:FAD/FMN-containing dehydrogenase